MRFLSIMHLRDSVTRLPAQFRTLEHQTAWVMLFSAVPWVILEPGRSAFVVMYAAVGALHLFGHSRNQTRLRTPLLLFGCVAFGLGITYRPDSLATIPFGEHVLRVLLDIAIVHTVAALILITRRHLLSRRR